MVYIIIRITALCILSCIWCAILIYIISVVFVVLDSFVWLYWVLFWLFWVWVEFVCFKSLFAEFVWYWDVSCWCVEGSWCRCVEFWLFVVALFCSVVGFSCCVVGDSDDWIECSSVAGVFSWVAGVSWIDSFDVSLWSFLELLSFYYYFLYLFYYL